MTYLRRIKSIQKFCTELEEAADRTLKPFLQKAYYSPKGTSKQYLSDTFNSTLRKQPPIVKEEHKQACKSNFCKEMEKLLEKGIWIQSRYKRVKKEVPIQPQRDSKDQNWRHEIKRYKTPTFSNFNSSKHQKPVNEQDEFEYVTNSKHNSTTFGKRASSLKRSTREQNSYRTIKQYQAKLAETQTDNNAMKQRLERVEHQNEVLKRVLNQSDKFSFKKDTHRELKKKSKMREQKIKDLLQELGIPLVERQSPYSNKKEKPSNFEKYKYSS